MPSFPVSVVVLALAWTVTTVLTAQVGLAGQRGYSVGDHRLFLPLWTVVTVSTIFMGRSVLARSPRTQVAIIVAVVVFGVAYYGVGRPVELASLRAQAIRRLYPWNEMGFPLAMGLIVVLIYVSAAHLGRTRTHSGARIWTSARYGGSVYLLTGALLWLHSAVAWLVVKVGTGVSQTEHVPPWLRFVDDVKSR